LPDYHKEISEITLKQSICKHIFWLLKFVGRRRNEVGHFALEAFSHSRQADRTVPNQWGGTGGSNAPEKK
jgi:hypothetical protein